MNQLIVKTMEKLIEKIPDVWFDWYVRFIPGAIGILIYVFIHNKFPNQIDFGVIFFFILISYLIGHILQPLTGSIVKGLELLLDSLYKKSREKDYSKAKSDSDFNPSSIGKVNKAHAEANSMLSIFIVTLINIFVSPTGHDYTLLIMIAPFYFLTATIGRIWARRRKIKDLG